MQLSLKSIVAETLNNRGREEGVAVRRNNEAQVAKTTNNHFVILEHVQNVLYGHAAFESAFLALVGFESLFEIRPLIWLEPSGFLWQVWNDEEKQDLQYASDVAQGSDSICKSCRRLGSDGKRVRAAGAQESDCVILTATTHVKMPSRMKIHLHAE